MVPDEEQQEEQYLLKNCQRDKYGAAKTSSYDRFRPLRSHQQSIQHLRQGTHATGFSRVFSYSSYIHKFFIVIGCLSAIVHGTGIPFLVYNFGLMTNYFLEAQQHYPFNHHINNTAPSIFTITFPTEVIPNATLVHHNNAISVNTSVPTSAPNGDHANENLPSLLSMQSADLNTQLLQTEINNKLNVNKREIQVNDAKTDDLNKSVLHRVSGTNKSEKTENNATTLVEMSTLPSSEEYLTTVTIKPNSSAQNFEEYFKHAIKNYVLHYLYLGGTVLVAAYLQALCWQLSCDQLMYRLHQDFFYQVLRQDSNWFSSHQSKSIILSLIFDLKSIQNGIGLQLGNFLRYFSTFVTSLAISFSVQWQLTAIALSSTPFLAVLLGLIGKYLEAYTQHEEMVIHESSRQVKDTIACIRTVASYMGQGMENKRYKEQLEIEKKSANKKNLLQSFSLGIMFLSLYCTYALLCWFSIYLKDTDLLPSIGNIFTVAFCIMITFFSLGHIVPSFQALVAADSASAHIFSIINNIPKIDPYMVSGCRPVATKGTIKFSNVSFTRPTQDIATKSKLEMLRHLTITLKAGQTIAIVGSDECGKDLLKELLFRFYDPLEGQIYLDGHDLKSLNVHWLRNIVCYIEKDPVFFERMVIENIMAGLDAMAFEDVIEAAKNLQSHDFILSLPQGYATVIGEKEVTLSAEVKQLIAMVRSSLRNPHIVIIDESPETVDRETVAAFNTALQAFQKDRTILIVAKRLSTVKKADHVIVLQDGWVIAQGTYQELSTQDVLLHYLLKTNILINDINESDADKTADEQMNKKIFSSNLHKRRPSPWIPTEAVKTVVYKKNKWRYLWRILSLCKSNCCLFLLGCICAIVYGFTSPVAAFLLAELFNIFSDNPMELGSNAYNIAIAFVILATAASMSYMLKTIFFLLIGERMVQQLHLISFSNILNQPLKWLEEEAHCSENLAAILADKSLTMAVNDGFGTLLSSLVCLFSGIVMGMIYGWQLASAIIGSTLLLLLVGMLLVKLTFSKRHTYNHYMNDATQVICEAVKKLWTIQALTMERRILENYVDKLTVPYFLSKKQAQLYSIVYALAHCMVYFVYALIFLLSLYLVLGNINSPIEVIRVIFATAVCLVALIQLLKLWPTYDEICNTATTLFQLVDLPVSNSNNQKEGLKPDIRGSVTLKGVYFRHSAKMNVPLLQGMDMTIKPGQMVAVVGGGSGCILDLINRLYDPLVGQILIDDFGVHQLTLSHLRHNVSLIGDPLIISGTLHENIIYGADESMINSSRMDTAIKLSGITEFVWDLPQKWHTVLGENGIMLRRKDQIRIALARVCLRDPRIILVKDIFKTVIPEDMPMVLKAFRNVSRSRTCIITTTAVGILRSADWIFVLDKGKITEHGKHDTLFAKRGAYFGIYHQNTSGIT